MTESPLRVVIVDDEPLARVVVREYITMHPGVEVVAECANGFEAVKAVSELSPDLVFLDVQMPKLSGFEVLELIGRQVPVVFTTAYDQYALRAFDVHAIDYLLKPFNEQRFAEALARARERLAARDTAPVDALVSETRAKQTPLERVLIRDGSQVHVLPVDKIDYVEAQDDYVAFRSEGKSYLKDQTLGVTEALLDPARFVRIHRSTIVNIARVQRLERRPYGDYEVVLVGGTRLRMSRARRKALERLLPESGSLHDASGSLHRTRGS